MSNINFGKLHPNEIKKFQKFIRKYWIKKNHIFSTDDKIFNWQYRKNSSYNFFTAKKYNNLIGVQGFIPLKHFDKNKNNNQNFLAFRRVIEGKHIAVGLKLHKEVFEECKPKFAGVIVVDKETHNFLRWQGFNVEKMDHHVILSQFVNKFKIAKVNNFKISYKKKNKKFSLVKLNTKNIKLLLNSKFYQSQMPRKSNNYIINRYLKHPFYKYQVFLIKNKNIPKALMVIRPIKIKNSLVLRFVDFIGTYKSFLLTYDVSIKLLKQYKAEYIDIYSYGISKKIFKQSGYTDRYEKKDLIIPNNFEPFEQKNINIFCAFKSNYKNKIIRLFKGDGDGDRPNSITRYKFGTNFSINSAKI